MPGVSLRAGVGRAIITPPLTAPHAGWGAQTHVTASGVETDLWATVLVVTDGQEMAALVDLDLVLISREEAQAIRVEVAGELGVAPEKVRVSLTHTHAGPPPSSWDWADQGKAALRSYYQILPAMAAGAARAALLKLRPARVAAGSGQSAVAVNRRETAPDGRTVTGVNAGGPIDPHLLVVRLDGADGSPLAAVVGYTMHPTTMGPKNRLISADWPGHLKRTVETLTGAACLFVQGAAGDVGPGPAGFTDDSAVIRRLGAMIGCEAVRVYLGLNLPPVEYRHDRVWESGAPLGKWAPAPLTGPPPLVRALARELPLPLGQQPTPEDAASRLAAAQDRLRELADAGAPASELEAATFVVKRANMALTRARTFSGRSEFPVELHLLQIGPAVLAAIPCEPFVRTGLGIKAASPFPETWFGGYAGGWFGYIPTPEEFPRRGYEVDTSPFAPEAARKVVEGTVTALRDLYLEWNARGGDPGGRAG